MDAIVLEPVSEEIIRKSLSDSESCVNEALIESLVHSLAGVSNVSEAAFRVSSFRAI